MIVFCASDMIFATKISATAEAMGVGARQVGNGASLAKRLDQIDDGKLNEKVTGVMLDLALGDDAIVMIEQAKAHETSPPVIAFGSHVDTDVLQAARDAGADQVLARSAFVTRLTELLEEFGRELA